MSYISKFKYDTAYSNADIAEALAVITGAGVSDVDAPNDILLKISEEGVTYSNERCKVSISGSKVSIAPGTVIMPDGSYIIIYTVETFTIDTAKKYYVYIESVAAGNNVPKCETELPGEDVDYILLAEVSSGIVTDKRQFARGKTAHTSGPGLVKLENPTKTDSGAEWTYDVSDINIVNGVVFIPSSPIKGHFAVFIRGNNKYIGYNGITDDRAFIFSVNFSNVYFSVNITESSITLSFPQTDSGGNDVGYFTGVSGVAYIF